MKTSGRKVINDIEVTYHELDGHWCLAAQGAKQRYNTDLYTLEEALESFTEE